MVVPSTATRAPKYCPLREMLGTNVPRTARAQSISTTKIVATYANRLNVSHFKTAAYFWYGIKI